MTKISLSTKQIYMPYNPSKPTREILTVAWDYIQEANYEPGAREVFYNLFDRGFFDKQLEAAEKTAIKKGTKINKGWRKKKAHFYWINYTSNARRRFFEGWKPDTFCDEHRSIAGTNLLFEQSDDIWVFDTILGWTNNQLFISKSLHLPHDVKLSTFPSYDTIVEVWYETAANTNFFETYTNGVILRPFSGQNGIEKKWQIFMKLRQYNLNWPDKKVHILYFGDYDEKGKQIPETVVDHIYAWAEKLEKPVDFEFHRIAVLKEHVKKYNLTDDPDKADKFEFEALSQQVRIDLLKKSLKKYLKIDDELLLEIKRKEETTNSILEQKLEKFDYHISHKVEGSEEFRDEVIKELKKEGCL